MKFREIFSKKHEHWTTDIKPQLHFYFKTKNLHVQFIQYKKAHYTFSAPKS